MKKNLLLTIACFIALLSKTQISPASQWTWMKDNNTADATGIYGTKAASSTRGDLNDLWKLSTSVNGPLPVTLLNIVATPKNNVVDVMWKTSQEINTSHFAVERSDDGRTFSFFGYRCGSRQQRIPQALLTYRWPSLCWQ